MGLIDNLPTSVQALVVVISFAGISITGAWLVRKFVPPEVLRDDHEVAGFTFGVVGAFYGVVLAFVIVAAWERFDRADAKAQGEALALSNLYSLSFGFDEPMRSQVVGAVRGYAEEVADHEWQEMARDSYQRSFGGESALWHVLLSYEPHNNREQIVLDKSLDAMGDLSDARQLRYVYYREDLPSVVWLVIYVGCAITIGFSFFFGTHRFRSLAMMCGVFASLLGLTIMAISELSSPYSGAVNVSAEPFRFVQQMIDKDAVGKRASNAGAAAARSPQ